MNDNIIAERKKKFTKRKRIYFFLGWPMILIGMGLLFYKPVFALSMVFIICGLFMRVLYYYVNIELRALDRYEELLNKTKLLIISGFVIFTFSHSVDAQLKEDDNALELKGMEWVVGDQIRIFDEVADPKIFVIQFWAPWDKASLLSLPLLNKIHQEYMGEEICVIAITKEKKDGLKKYLDSIKKKIDFRIAVDSKGEITKKYMGEGAGIPKVYVIGKNKKLLWSGNPVVLESVIKKILKGTFDSDIQKELNLLQIKLQNKMQMDKIAESVEISNRILELDPSNELALRIRLFIFERSGKLDDAVSFIQGQIDRNPDEPQLYFIKLDILERIESPLEQRKKTCEDIYERFRSDHEVLERLAWTSIARMRFGTAPLSVAFAASEKAVSMLVESKKQSPAKLANYLETQARLYYSIGKISEAVEIQEKVLRLRQGDAAEEDATAILDYYKEALKLAEK